MQAAKKEAPVRRERKRAKIIKIGKIKKPKITLIGIVNKCFSLPVLFLFVMICVIFTINLRIQIYDTQKAITKANQECERLISENTLLKCKIEKISSYDEIMKFAKKHHMIKKSEAQIYYIDTGRKDYAEIIDE